MQGSRAEILRRIRLSLTRPEREHLQSQPSEVQPMKALFASTYRFEALVETFRKEFELVSGEITVCKTSQAVLETVKRLICSASLDKVAVSQHAVCQRLQLIDKLRSEMPDRLFVGEQLDTGNPFDRLRLRRELSEVQLAITGAEYLIADTGTIVVTAGPQASRQISLLPAIHVVLATPDQIYPNMADLFSTIQEVHGDRLPGSALTLITGPSRTADIEKVLIKGVHGPNRLLAIIWENGE